MVKSPEDRSFCPGRFLKLFGPLGSPLSFFEIFFWKFSSVSLRAFIVYIWLWVSKTSNEKRVGGLPPSVINGSAVRRLYIWKSLAWHTYRGAWAMKLSEMLIQLQIAWFELIFYLFVFRFLYENCSNAAPSKIQVCGLCRHLWTWIFFLWALFSCWGRSGSLRVQLQANKGGGEVILSPQFPL